MVDMQHCLPVRRRKAGSRFQAIRQGKGRALSRNDKAGIFCNNFLQKGGNIFEMIVKRIAVYPAILHTVLYVNFPERALLQ